MKVWNYVVITLGLLALFDYAGLITDGGGVLTLMGFVRDGGSITFDPGFSTFFNFAYSNIAELGLGVLAGLGLAGIAIGTFAKGKLENFIILPIITTVLVLFVGGMKQIVQDSLAEGAMPVWIGGVIAFIGLVYIGGFLVALYEHFRGTD